MTLVLLSRTRSLFPSSYNAMMCLSVFLSLASSLIKVVSLSLAVRQSQTDFTRQTECVTEFDPESPNVFRADGRTEKRTSNTVIARVSEYLRFFQTGVRGVVNRSSESRAEEGEMRRTKRRSKARVGGNVRAFRAQDGRQTDESFALGRLVQDRGRSACERKKESVVGRSVDSPSKTSRTNLPSWRMQRTTHASAGQEKRRLSFLLSLGFYERTSWSLWPPSCSLPPSLSREDQEGLAKRRF